MAVFFFNPEMPEVSLKTLRAEVPTAIILLGG